MAKRTPVGRFGTGRPGISPLGWALRGAAAGAAGTTALNAVTYLDMAARGRASSSTPEQTVEKLAEKAHLPIPGEGQTRQNRLQGLGPLTGLAAGVGAGILAGLARAAGLRARPPVGVALAAVAAMVAGNGPMAVLGITDPRSWSAIDWASDVVPHLAYGAVVKTTMDAFDRRSATAPVQRHRRCRGHQSLMATTPPMWTAWLSSSRARRPRRARALRGRRGCA